HKQVTPSEKTANQRPRARGFEAASEIGRVMRHERMEPLWSPVVAIGGNHWQNEQAQKAQKQAKTVAAGCHRLLWTRFCVVRFSRFGRPSMIREVAYGTEGVSGGVPSAGAGSGRGGEGGRRGRAARGQRPVGLHLAPEAADRPR